MPVRDFIQDVLNGESNVPANCERQYIMVVLARLKGAARNRTQGDTFSTTTDLNSVLTPTKLTRGTCTGYPQFGCLAA